MKDWSSILQILYIFFSSMVLWNGYAFRNLLKVYTYYSTYTHLYVYIWDNIHNAYRLFYYYISFFSNLMKTFSLPLQIFKYSSLLYCIQKLNIVLAFPLVLLYYYRTQVKTNTSLLLNIFELYINCISLHMCFYHQLISWRRMLLSFFPVWACV